MVVQWADSLAVMMADPSVGHGRKFWKDRYVGFSSQRFLIFRRLYSPMVQIIKANKNKISSLNEHQQRD